MNITMLAVLIERLGPGIPDQSPQTSVGREHMSHARQASRVISKSILGGLHHEYRWANAA
jgi:hypothetical protein